MADNVLPSRAARPRPIAADWGAKAILVFCLAVLMSIPGLFVFSLVIDRQHRASETTQSVSTLQGGQQALLGPVLVAPYQVPRPAAPDANGKLQPQLQQEGWYVVSPETGSASVGLKTTTLHRGIF